MSPALGPEVVLHSRKDRHCLRLRPVWDACGRLFVPSDRVRTADSLPGMATPCGYAA